MNYTPEQGSLWELPKETLGKARELIPELLSLLDKYGAKMYPDSEQDVWALEMDGFDFVFDPEDLSEVRVGKFMRTIGTLKNDP